MKMKILLCMSLLAVSCLCGCRQKEKVSFSETYDTESISSINMQIDSWQLKIMASSDEDVHISLDGGTDKGAKATSVEVHTLFEFNKTPEECIKDIIVRYKLSEEIAENYFAKYGKS